MCITSGNQNQVNNLNHFMDPCVLSCVFSNFPSAYVLILKCSLSKKKTVHPKLKGLWNNKPF